MRCDGDGWVKAIGANGQVTGKTVREAGRGMWIQEGKNMK